MKVYIHYQFVTQGGWGGSNSFLAALARFFSLQPGIEVMPSIHQEADIFLMAGWSTGQKATSVREVRNMRRYGTARLWERLWRRTARPPKIVHRLDGIGYLYGRPDRSADERLADLNRLSDHTVVQSRYSETLFKKEGFILTPSTVISNGIDPAVFHPGGAACWDGARPLVFAAVSWSANPRKGHAAIAEFSKLPGVKVRFTGNWPDSINPAQVERRPPALSTDLGDFYRSCDAFLFPAKDEACPNALIEAMACGLPCLYHPSGGTPEIAAPFGVPLDEQNLQGSLDAFRAAYAERAHEVRENAGRRLSIDRVGRQYLDLFQKLLA